MKQSEVYFLRTWRGMCNYEQDEAYDGGDKVDKARG